MRIILGDGFQRLGVFRDAYKPTLVVIMCGRTLTYSAMLKDRDYDVTAHIFLILSLTLTQNARGGRRRFARWI